MRGWTRWRSDREPGETAEARCPVPLTGAVVRCPESDDGSPPGGRLEDLGVAVVVDGRYPPASEILDLGSGRRSTVDLGGEAVVLGWLPARALEEIQAEGGPTPGELALRLLRRRGFTPRTRPIFLRLGFQDICRDLDPHENAAVRIRLGPRRVARLHLDYESGAVVVRTGRSERDPDLEDALATAFPGREVRSAGPDEFVGSLSYRLPGALPDSLDDARAFLDGVRGGLEQLSARFEKERFQAVHAVTAALGARETLGRFSPAEGKGRPAQPPRARFHDRPASSWVH